MTDTKIKTGWGGREWVLGEGRKGMGARGTDTNKSRPEIQLGRKGVGVGGWGRVGRNSQIASRLPATISIRMPRSVTYKLLEFQISHRDVKIV